MPKYQCKFDNPGIHGVTGHHTVEVHILEFSDDESQLEKGVMEVWGIDLLALERKYSGDIEKWLQDIAQQMLEKHILRQKVHARLNEFKSRTIDLGSGKKTEST